MPIAVICPGCKKEFNVSDQFAGRSGPCPSCKTVIKVPKKEEQVVVHAPEQFASAGKGMGGKMVAKPIRRLDAKWSPLALSLVATGSLLVVAAAWAGGRSHLFQNWIVPSFGLILLSPLLTIGGYKFLVSSEDLEQYQGNQLYLRAGICALAYVVLWGIFFRVAAPVLAGHGEEIWLWAFIGPPFLIVGAITALSSFDFDFGSGALHYCFYVFVILLLRWVAALPSVWNLPAPS
jgi:hypothetical protein